MKKKAKIGVIILAAGSSSRLGYPKQLVSFRGKSLLQHSIDVARSLEYDTNVLVLGFNAIEIRDKINSRDFNVVTNEKWEEGMGTSISRGISEGLSLENDLDHILILLSDQPFLSKDKIRELIHVHLESEMPATFSEYAGNIGVPAILSRELFPELQMLKGDQGAKKLMTDKNFEFKTVNFENGIFDVDSPADVELLKQMEKE